MQQPWLQLSISEKATSGKTSFSEKSKVSETDTYFAISSMPFWSSPSVEYFLLVANTNPSFEILKINLLPAALDLVNANISMLSRMAAIISSQSDLLLHEILVKMVLPLRDAKINL